MSTHQVRRLMLTVGLVGIMALTASCGSSSSQAASDCKPIALASIGPITGVDSATGRAPRNSAELAVRHYNESHADCPVGLLTYDSKGTPDIAANLVSAIVGDPQIVGVVGPVFSGDSKAILPELEKAGLAMLTGSATFPGLSANGWKTFHRLVANDATQAPAAVSYMVDRLQAKNVAVIDESGLFGKTIADLVTQDLKDKGVNVAVRLSVDSESLSYKDAVAQVKAAGVDAVYFGGLGPPAGRFTRQLRDAKVTAPLVGADPLYDATFIATAGSAAVGVVATCACVSATPQTPEQAAFRENYKAAFGEDPGYFAAEYYDVASLYLDAIAHGNTTRKGIQDWLQTADYPGLTKQVQFDETGEVKAGAIFLYQVDPDLKFVPIGVYRNGELTSS